MLPILLTNLALLAAAFAVLWVVSLPIRNASIVDPFWGMAFVIVAWSAVLRAAPGGPRATLAVALVTLWGLRLSVHLVVRNAGHGEDRRYAAMRAGHGPRFWWVSLFTVFLLQAGLAWFISLPVQVAASTPSTGLGPLDLLAVLFFSVGLFFEVVGDLQLTRFRADPASRGKALETGLWRYTRHPNYFGDACAWWGLGLLGVAAGAWWAAAGPALLTFLLLRVSGVAMLERDLADRRPAWRDYAARTSAFFPWPPRKARP